MTTPQGSSHPTNEALELYVVGAHDEVAVDAVEAHLRQCEACTEEVRRQVRVDMALAEVAAEAQFCPGCSAVLAAARCPACGSVAVAGDFQVLRVLVQNGHGRLYLAHDRNGQQVALKELAFVQPPHPDALDAFEREARLLRQLSHPQIPRFLASFRDGEGVNTRLYLAQEYVDGESLLARLAGHQFCEAEAIEVAFQVLHILEYLQSLSPMVFHRDIKPANLLRRRDGRISLVDFGAARDLGSTVGATLVGTFGYMPLEQMGGIVDSTTDLYALGATLAQLLSRREPWSFLEDPRALERLNVSAPFRQFLGKLLARRPADRHPSAAAAMVALGEVTRRRRRHRASWRQLARGRWAAMTAALAGFATALGFSYTLHSPPARRHVAAEPEPEATPVPRSKARAMRLPRRRGVLTDPFRPGPPEHYQAAVFIPPKDAEKQRLALPPGEGGPAPARVPPGKHFDFTARICVSTHGNVTEVSSVTERPDEALLRYMRTWKYRPYIVDGRALPFCTHVRIRSAAMEKW
jgi:hypothetical protein